MPLDRDYSPSRQFNFYHLVLRVIAFPFQNFSGFKELHIFTKHWCIVFHIFNSNANCPNRPSQNEYRKRVPVRLHPLSCDFSATSLISVIAKLRAPSRRAPLPRRHSECGFGVRGQVRASAFIRFRRDKLVRRDMSRRGKRQHVAAIQKRCHAIALHIKNRPARSGGRS